MGDDEGKETHYEDYDYDELPEEVKSAANTLGKFILSGER